MAVLVACYDPQRVLDPKAVEAWQDRYRVKAPVFASGVFVLRTNDPAQLVFESLQTCLKPHANLFVGILGASPFIRPGLLLRSSWVIAGEP
jgi:hypothetical protein